MSTILSCKNLSKSFGAQKLFSNINFSLLEGEKVGLLGPNGAGKSTFLKILIKQLDYDSGELFWNNRVNPAYVEQQENFTTDQSIGEILEETLRANPLYAHSSSEELNALIIKKLSEISLSETINSQFTNTAQLNTDQLNTDQVKAELINTDQIKEDEFLDSPSNQHSFLATKACKLSGGWKKRLSLIKAIINEPSVLLLDEPTNHLDISGIAWLENFIRRSKLSMIFITHDRSFLENCSDRVVELNPIFKQGYFSSTGNYSKFLERRASFVESEESYKSSLENKVRGEIDWLRQGARARTTKAKGRIDQAHKLISDLDEMKTRSRSVKEVKLEFLTTSRTDKDLISIKNLDASFFNSEELFFSDLTVEIKRGSKLAIIGNNGSGKTTLLKILEEVSTKRTNMGSFTSAPETLKNDPTKGASTNGDRADTVDNSILNSTLTIKKGKLSSKRDLIIKSFSQFHDTLNGSNSIKEELAPEGDGVVFKDELVHIFTWGNMFGFSPAKMQSPISSLSGGERARVALSKLMLHPADILMLDEPTNDLDIATLEVLENALKKFEGALILVSHDRYLISATCNQYLAIRGPNQGSAEDNNQRHEYFSSFDQVGDFLSNKRSSKSKIKQSMQLEDLSLDPSYMASKSDNLNNQTSTRNSSDQNTGANNSKTTSKMDRKQVQKLESKISKLEEKLASIKEEINKTSFGENPTLFNQLCDSYSSLSSELDLLIEEWSSKA